MLEHVWRRAKKSKLLNEIIIACDDQRVLTAAQSFGAQAVMTSTRHASGTDRIAEVIKNLKVSVVVNIQADEPLIDPKVIDHLAQALLKDKNYEIATVIKILDKKEELDNPNVVKVVIDHKQNALYFSRALIPYNRAQTKITTYKHLGIYAYRKNFLLKFTKLPKSELENIEKLEQLRALEAGYKIKTVLTDHETIGVDTPEDLERVQKLLMYRLHQNKI